MTFERQHHIEFVVCACRPQSSSNGSSRLELSSPIAIEPRSY